jgi:Cd2+/Zn2+-exporting ATPase
MKNNETDNTDQGKQAVLKLQGADCASCAHTIERVGRKLDGISYIRVDASSSEVHITYDGDETPVEKIEDVIRRLGYSSERVQI